MNATKRHDRSLHGVLFVVERVITPRGAERNDGRMAVGWIAVGLKLGTLGGVCLTLPFSLAIELRSSE